MPQEPTMSVSFIGLFVLVGLAGLVFMAVLGLIALLTNPRTRNAAKILLGAGAAVVLLLVLLGGLFVGFYRTRAVQTARMELEAVEQAQAQLQRQIELGDKPEPAPEVAPPKEPIEIPLDEEAPSSDSEATEEKAEETPEEEAPAPKKPDEAGPGKLSVPPLGETGPAPAWVESKPHKEDSVYFWPIATTPRADAIEAEEEALPEAFDAAVADYIRTKLKLGARAARQVHLGRDYLEKLIGDDTWVEPLDLSVGEFVRLHALVKFDRDANEKIRQQWERQRLVGRLYSAAGLLCVVLLFLAFAYCYLKIDQITNGSRRALLRIAAILVILGLTLATVVVVSVSVA